MGLGTLLHHHLQHPEGSSESEERQGRVSRELHPQLELPGWVGLRIISRRPARPSAPPPPPAGRGLSWKQGPQHLRQKGPRFLDKHLALQGLLGTCRWREWVFSYPISTPPPKKEWVSALTYLPMSSRGWEECFSFVFTNVCASFTPSHRAITCVCVCARAYAKAACTSEWVSLSPRGRRL